MRMAALVRPTVQGGLSRISVLKAFTLKQVNASTKILERLGFEIGSAHDADAGEAMGVASTSS